MIDDDEAARLLAEFGPVLHGIEPVTGDLVGPRATCLTALACLALPPFEPGAWYPPERLASSPSEVAEVRKALLGLVLEGLAERSPDGTAFRATAGLAEMVAGCDLSCLAAAEDDAAAEVIDLWAARARSRTGSHGGGA